MSEKTEPATPKRLREAREKGDIAKSQDIPSALVVMSLVVYMIVNGGDIFQVLSELTTAVFTSFHLPYEQALAVSSTVVVRGALSILSPIIAMVLLVALLSNLWQVGVLFSFKAAMPKLENLSPSKWFQKVFAMKNAVEFLKSIFKVVVLALTVWFVLLDYFRELFLIPNGDIRLLWFVLGSILKDLTLTAASVFCVIAGFDYLYQKWQYNKKNMMSKDEVKREYKEMDGDPYIKSKRKQLQQELLSQSSLDKVRRAKVLVTNPTHYAIAIDYEKDKTPLPIIVAKGEGLLAQRMIKEAERNGVPIMRDVKLARELFATGTENSYIPKDLIVQVAEVLRWVQSLNNNR